MAGIRGKSSIDAGAGADGSIDLTAAEEYARALKAEHEVVEQLRAVDEMKNAFLSALSHELRTPITAILGLSRTIERDYERLNGDEIREFTRRISAKAAKLDRLLTDLLDLDRLR